ncbi:hypothetical protein COU13_01025 [Candidatus Kaiserbacteria bacterium CG10_big_fil_rev_8_21_14_0_10_43_70]|uniref:Uncharacterized protein n=1 Tax=Candidatus Kaiserbacteria bacterium CG10_big_fil_rev_8_21_14_0_10_43_70 TaxID=1974605 RepID=A0A2H0UJ52_9BACT|nr:MAG: hypothetical protein COU13_01025 [Candidatus Kaiserbacteria bacterium CG10_big_fil_rev_8_21_14_0_10_43_70]
MSFCGRAFVAYFCRAYKFPHSHIANMSVNRHIGYMVNVSKDSLDARVQKRIDERFVDFFASCRDKKEVARVFDELLGEEEKVMLVKRVAIIMMLGNNYSSYEIRKALKVSGEMERRLRDKLDSGEMATLEKFFCSNRARHTKRTEVDTKKLLELIMYAGMPPFEYKGRRRWVQKMRDRSR